MSLASLKSAPERLAPKRLASINVNSTPEKRNEYRHMLFTTPHLEQFISGVILYDETLRQILSNGKIIPDYLNDLGILLQMLLKVWSNKIN